MHSQALLGVFGLVAFAAVFTLEYQAQRYFYTYLLVAVAALLVLIAWEIGHRRGSPPVSDYPYGGSTAPRTPSRGSPPEHRT